MEGASAENSDTAKPAAERESPTLAELVERLALSLSLSLPLPERVSLGLQLLAPYSDVISFTRDGTRWTAPLWDEVVGRVLFFSGGFQLPEIVALVAWMRRHDRLAPPRDVIVDVGAHIGTSAIPFAQQTECRILAIEPMPEAFDLLCRNIADNGFDERILPLRTAIFAGAERVRMVSPERNGGAGEVRRTDRPLSFARTHAIRSEVEVEAIGLAALLDAQGVAPERVAFVWSDSQGSEPEVIESGAALWAAGVPLLSECDPNCWTGPSGREAQLAAARRHFSRFLSPEALTGDGDAEIRPIAALDDYFTSLSPFGSDVLLLP